MLRGYLFLFYHCVARLSDAEGCEVSAEIACMGRGPDGQRTLVNRARAAKQPTVVGKKIPCDRAARPRPCDPARMEPTWRSNEAENASFPAQFTQLPRHSFAVSFGSMDSHLPFIERKNCYTSVTSASTLILGMQHVAMDQPLSPLQCPTTLMRMQSKISFSLGHTCKD